MSYIHSKVELARFQHGGNAYILEPDDEDIHPSHQWAKYPADQNVNMDSHKIENLANPSASTDGVNKSFLESNYLQTDGSNSMTANLDMNSNKVTNVVDPSNPQEASTKNYIDSNYYDQSTSDSRFLRTDGNNSMSANLDVGDNKLTNVNDPTNNKDAVNLQYLNANSSSNVKIKEVTDVQSSTLSQNGAISHSKQVTGLTDQQYLCRIQLIVWGNFSGNFTYLQHLLQDDGFTDQYDPIKQTQQSNTNVSRFQLQNGGEVGRENQQTSIYNFTLLTNTTQQITFNTDVIDDGGLSSDTTVHTKLHVFISPASIL